VCASNDEWGKDNFHVFPSMNLKIGW